MSLPQTVLNKTGVKKSTQKTRMNCFVVSVKWPVEWIVKASRKTPSILIQPGNKGWLKCDWFEAVLHFCEKDTEGEDVKEEFFGSTWIKGAHSNLSQDWIQAIIPAQQNEGETGKSSCSRYDLDQAMNFSMQGIKPISDWTENQRWSGSSILLSSLKQEGCKDGWSYSTEYFQSTVVTEFDLVCSDQWKKPLTSLMYFLGALLGCGISGQISDRFGRKPVLFGSIAILGVFSGALSFAPSWPVFTVLFFLLGVGQMTCYITAFVLGSELLLGSKRVLFSSLCLPITFVCAMMMLPGTAYLIRNWRQLSLLMAIPGLACLPLWWSVPESPRWLVSCGRSMEAELLLRLAAIENRVEAPLIIFSSATPESKTQTLSFINLLKTSNIRRVTLTLWIVWFSISVSYFGVSFNTSSLSGNPYFNYFLLTVVEIPAYLISWMAACSLSRRISFISFSLLGAVALLLIQMTINSRPGVTLALVLMGKFGILVGMGVLYIYTGELSPTVIRNTAMSSCAMFSRMGSAVSPYLLELAVFQQLLPWIIVGSLSILSVVLCIFLPETFRKPLPDTIQQMPVSQWPCCSTSPPKEEEKSTKYQSTSPDVICTTHL